MTAEMGARRRRLRAALGDRGQALIEFLVLGGLLVGSAGLFLAPWMPAAAPWGFALPFIFVAGYLLLERRRQRRAADAPDAAANGGYDWAVLIWAFACAVAGAAAFFIAYQARPAPAPGPQDWQPPRGAVTVDLPPGGT